MDTYRANRCANRYVTQKWQLAIEPVSIFRELEHISHKDFLNCYNLYKTCNAFEFIAVLGLFHNMERYFYAAADMKLLD